MTTADLSAAREMLEFLDASPSPYHACDETGARLGKAGFRRLSEVDAWDLGPGRYFVVRGGSPIDGRRHPPAAPTGEESVSRQRRTPERR